MKVVNRTGNTVYVEDIDTHFPYQDGKTETIDPDTLKRSRCLRSFIISGMFDVIEYDESEKIENSIMYLKGKHGPTVRLGKPKVVEEQIEYKEPVDLQSCTDEIEVKIHGIFLDAGGYAKVNRNLALKLAEAGIKVKVDPKRSTNQLTETELAPIMALQKTQISRNHILIDSIIPSFAELSTGKYRVLYTTIESYSLPKQFIDCCEMYDEIWLTSEWSAEILRKHVKKPIYSIVTGIDPFHYCEVGPKFDLRPKVKDFIFISVFGWNYRKGYDVLLRAYLDEFSAEDNVSLLLVSRYQSGQSRYHKNKVGDEIDEFMKEFPNKDLPHIVRFSKVTPEKDMPKIYRACDCFVLPSRGEGGCTLAGTQIITREGLQPIEIIGEGTEVLTHQGRWRKVTSTRERYTEEPIYNIKSSMNSDIISLTGEHPCLVLRHNKTVHNYGKKDKTKFKQRNCEWLTPAEISPNDYLYMPMNFTEKVELDSFEPLQYLNNTMERNGNIYRLGRNQYGSEFSHPNVKPISTKIQLTEKFLKLLGFYISEGCAKSNSGQITFTFHSKETVYHNIVTDALKEVFNTNSEVLKYNDDREFRHSISCNNSLLNELLTSLCGRGSHNKHLPDFTWKMSKDQIKLLLFGVFSGDGCFYNPGSSPALTLSTVSRQLADDTMLALRMVGISACKQYKKKRGYVVSIKGQQLNELYFIKGAFFDGEISERTVRTDEGVYLPVREISRIHYAGKVYNLEVDEDQSYTTNCFTVHNCLPPLEASMCGLPVIMTNCSGQQGYLRPDNAYLLEIDHLAQIQPGQMHLHYWDGQQFPALTSPGVHNSLKNLMRTVVNDKEGAKRRNRNLQNMILENFTWNNTANQAITRLREIQKKLKG